MPRRIARWLWTGQGYGPASTRLPLVPVALAYRYAMRARAAWGARRVPALPALPIPTVVVGSVLAGGAGKTPLASWIACALRQLGMSPGIVLRPYGGDESRVHQMLMPGVSVVEDANRRRGVVEAAQLGCDGAGLDDAYQRKDLRGDLVVGLVPADAGDLPGWTHPAGPWREEFSALRRADVLVVTRKQADQNTADRVIHAIRRRWPAMSCAGVHLCVRRLPYQLQGRSLLVSAGIADPASLVTFCQRLGANVRLVAWSDHHHYTERDLAHLLQIGTGVDYVVTTEKDAVKLRGIWPEGAPSPLVAALEVAWETGREFVSARLERLAPSFRA